MIFFDEKLGIFRSSKLNDSFFGGFTTSTFGDARNRNLLKQYLDTHGISYQTIAIPKQIHSVHVETVDEKNAAQPTSFFNETDGLVTKQKKIVLSVITADCVPILFADKKNKIIAAGHLGWRGTLHGLQKNIINAMIAEGSKKENIVAVIGPSINECCYLVDLDRYTAFMDEFERFSEDAIHNRSGIYHLNLSRLNYLLLVEAGLSPSHIDFFPFCTKCDKKRFFSYRRDNKKNYGEMASFIVQSSS